MNIRLRVTLVLGVCLLGESLPFWVRAEQQTGRGSAAQKIQFNRDIRPILSNRCFKCHGPDLKKGGLDLQTRDTALKRLKSDGLAIVPGNSAESLLIQRVTAEDATERMPPRGEPLSAAEIARLKAWIDQG